MQISVVGSLRFQQIDYTHLRRSVLAYKLDGNSASLIRILNNHLKINAVQNSKLFKEFSEPLYKLVLDSGDNTYDVHPTQYKYLDNLPKDLSDYGCIPMHIKPYYYLEDVYNNTSIKFPTYQDMLNHLNTYPSTKMETSTVNYVHPVLPVLSRPVMTLLKSKVATTNPSNIDSLINLYNHLKDILN